MSDLKKIYRDGFNHQAHGFVPVPLTAQHKVQLDGLEDILNQISGDGTEFSVELMGMDMAIAISQEDGFSLIPFTLRDMDDGRTLMQVDSSHAAPVLFDLTTDQESFVTFLAAEEQARNVRHLQVTDIVEHFRSKHAPEQP